MQQGNKKRKKQLLGLIVGLLTILGVMIATNLFQKDTLKAAEQTTLVDSLVEQAQAQDLAGNPLMKGRAARSYPVNISFEWTNKYTPSGGHTNWLFMYGRGDVWAYWDNGWNTHFLASATAKIQAGQTWGPQMPGILDQTIDYYAAKNPDDRWFLAKNGSTNASSSLFANFYYEASNGIAYSGGSGYEKMPANINREFNQEVIAVLRGMRAQNFAPDFLYPVAEFSYSNPTGSLTDAMYKSPVLQGISGLAWWTPAATTKYPTLPSQNKIAWDDIVPDTDEIGGLSASYSMDSAPFVYDGSNITAKPVTLPFAYPNYGDDNAAWSWTPSANDLKSWVSVEDTNGNAVSNYTVTLKNPTTVNTGTVGSTNYTVTVKYTDSAAGSVTKDIAVPVEVLKAQLQASKGDDGSFKVGAAAISNTDLKTYFSGKVNVISVNKDGSQAGTLVTGLSSGSYSTALQSPTWNSTGNPNPVTYTVNVTYDYTSGKYYNVLENRTVTAAWDAYYESANPLQIILKKIDKDTGDPLAGATFQLQRQNKSSGAWSGFVVDGNSEYVTDSNGQIILPQSVLDNIKYYGGDDDNYRFRFKETKAPDGYVQPTGDSMVTAAQAWSSETEGTQTLTMENTKEAVKPVPGNITIYYWRDGTEVTSSRRTINTSSYDVGDQITIPSPSGDWSDYTFNHAVINDTNHTVNTWPVKVTLTTAEQHVWVYYDKNPPAQTYGDVTVNYYIKGTKTKIQDSILLLGNAATKPVPTPPSSLSYQGKTYTLNPMAELNGLNLPASSATEVTMTADDQELNFYYDPPVEPKPASISVYYYIEDTTTPVHDMYSWIPANAIGSQVQAPASQEYTYQGDTYELVSYKLNTTGGNATSTSNPISVTVSATQQSVYYYYRKKAVTPTPGQPVTVNYYIENTTTALQNSTTITGNVGDNKPVPTPPATLTKDGITYELTSAELDGTEVALPFGTVLITNQQRTLNFYYKATTTPGGTVTVYYYQGQGNDTDSYTYVNGSKKELKANVGDVLDVTSSSVGDFTGYKFKVAYINSNSPSTNVTSPPVKVTVTDKAQTVWVYYEKEAPQYYLKQVQVPTQTYSAGINALAQGQWQELFGNGNMIAVMQQGDDNPLAYLDNTTYTFAPTLDTAQTPWNSTVGTDRTFKVTITPTPNLLGKFPGLQSIVADAKLTFIDTAYTLQLVVRNQDGEVATFAPSIDHPFVMQDISEGLGVDAWPYEGTVNATDRTIVGFPGFSFVAGTQYRVKQTATPGEDYPTLWNNGNMTKTFALTKDNELTVFQASGGGTPGDYAVANKEVKIDDTWSAKYDTNAKVLTFYFVNEEVPPGELTWTVPDDMDFGEVKTPVRQAQDIFLQAQQDQKNWQIAVSDTRQKNRNQWNITAQLTTPLINTVNQKQLAKNILKFKSTANGTAQDLSQATQIYQSAANPELGDTPITWNSTSGFYLDLISNGYYPVGQYVGNVTFTLNTTP